MIFWNVIQFPEFSYSISFNYSGQSTCKRFSVWHVPRMYASYATDRNHAELRNHACYSYPPKTSRQYVVLNLIRYDIDKIKMRVRKSA